MAKRISVVVSQSQGKNPAKRKLEEEIVAGLLFEKGIDVTIVPNLYDIKADATAMVALQQLNGHMIVCSWLFERAAHWILDRNGIEGMVGPVLLQNDDDDEKKTNLLTEPKNQLKMTSNAWLIRGQFATEKSTVWI